MLRCGHSTSVVLPPPCSHRTLGSLSHTRQSLKSEGVQVTPRSVWDTWWLVPRMSLWLSLPNEFPVFTSLSAKCSSSHWLHHPSAAASVAALGPASLNSTHCRLHPLLFVKFVFHLYIYHIPFLSRCLSSSPPLISPLFKSSSVPLMFYFFRVLPSHL